MRVITATRLSQPSPKVVSRAVQVLRFKSGETHGISCGRGGGVRGKGGGSVADAAGGHRLRLGGSGATGGSRKSHGRFDPQQPLVELRPGAGACGARAPEMASIRSRSGLAGSSGAGIPFQTTLRIKPMSDSGFPLPPPTFEFLVFSLKTQAEMQLGLFQLRRSIRGTAEPAGGAPRHRSAGHDR